MAYGLFLYKEFVSKSNKTIRLEIFQKDYAGISAEIESMGNNPLVLVSDNANSSVYLPIVKSYLDISIVDTNQVDYSVFFTPDATKFKVIVKVNGTPEWSGYLTPDSFEQDLRFRGDISLTARDNLGMLSEFDYDLTNSFYSITTLIDTALTKIGFQFTLEYRINKVDSLNETIRNGLTQSKFWVGKTWQEVLETILTGMGCQMRYVGDNKFAIYDIGYLSSLGTPHTPQTFSFIEQGGNQEIIPAWKVLTINQDYGLGDNIYDGFVEQSNYDFYAYRGGDVDNPYNFYLRPFYTIPLSSDWVSTIPMLSPYEYPNIDPNNLYITGKSPENTLFMSSKLIYGKYFEAISDGKAIQFKFKANNYPHYITQRRSGEYMVGAMLRARYLYTMKVRCNLFAQTATEKYVLQGQRWIPWTISYDDALEFNLPQTKESSVYGKQGTELTSQMDSPQDQDITIEAYGLGESANVWIEFYPYTATYTEVDGLGAVDDYPAIVFDVHTMKLSEFELRIVENETGGLESKVTINANHNINGAVDLSLGEVPSGLGGYHTYLAGIFKNSHPYYPPMTGFHFAGGTNYKLSELIGREVAHHYKTQKNKLSGTIINSLNFAAMPSFGKTFTDGVKNYALNYGALDFRNETMQVELIEVEDYVTEDYTFVEAEVESGSGSIGSGEREFVQWSAAGNAKRIYDLDTASEADQGGSYVMIDKTGLSAAKKVPISSLLVDAYTKTESDSRFASIDGDLTQDFSAKKLTTATLLLPQTAPILASGEVGIYSLDSGFSGEMPSGSGSVTSIALTMPTGFSVSGSPITESGTFGVTFASGYFLPTTTQFASKADVSLIGAANGIAPLDSGGKIALQYLPSTLLKYMGVWNASTNTPTLLATDVNRKGQVWNVSVAGTQFGIAFKLGDWLIYNDSGVAEKSDNSDDVTSVNGYTGAVTLKTSDIAEQTNLYYTDARVKAYADTLYTPLAHASATNNPHSVTAAQVGALALTGGTLSGNLAFLQPVGLLYSNGQYIKDNGTAGLVIYSENAINLNSLTLTANGNTIYHSGNSNLISINWSAAKLSSTTLLLPQSAPSLASGEMAIYGLESGFSGELPSGAGSVTSISMVVPTGLSVTPTTITESGTFTISYASGYQMMTSTESSKLAGIEANANNYTLPTATNLVLGGVKIGTNVTITDGVISVHNPVTLGTANGLSLSTQVLSLGLASTSTNGALSSTDWNTFNGKAAGDHTHAFAVITDKPTTISGYGITDALTTSNYSSYALPLSGGTMNDTKTINWNNNVVSWDDTTSGFRCISNLNDTYGYHAGFSFKGYYGLQLRTYAGGDTFTIRGHNGSDWSAWRNIIHSGNIGSQSVANADTLDGYDHSAFAKTGHLHNSFYTKYVYPNSIVQSTTAETLSGSNENLTAMFDGPSIWGGYANAFVYTGYNQYGSTQLITLYNATNGNNKMAFRVYNQGIGGYNNFTEVWTKDNLTNTLTPGYLPYWNGSSLVNSIISQSGSVISVTGEVKSTLGAHFGTIVGSNTLSAILGGYGISNGSVRYGNYGQLLFNAGNDWTAGARRWLITNAHQATKFAIIRSVDGLTNPSLGINGEVSSGIVDLSISNIGNIGIGYTSRTEKFAVDGTTYFNGNSQVVGSLTMTENINTNLRIPKVAPTSPTSGQYYFYIVE